MTSCTTICKELNLWRTSGLIECAQEVATDDNIDLFRPSLSGEVIAQAINSNPDVVIAELIRPVDRKSGPIEVLRLRKSSLAVYNNGHIQQHIAILPGAAGVEHTVNISSGPQMILRLRCESPLAEVLRVLYVGVCVLGGAKKAELRPGINGLLEKLTGTIIVSRGVALQACRMLPTEIGIMRSFRRRTQAGLRGLLRRGAEGSLLFPIDLVFPHTVWRFVPPRVGGLAAAREARQAVGSGATWPSGGGCGGDIGVVHGLCGAKEDILELGLGHCEALQDVDAGNLDLGAVADAAVLLDVGLTVAGRG